MISGTTIHDFELDMFYDYSDEHVEGSHVQGEAIAVITDRVNDGIAPVTVFQIPSSGSEICRRVPFSVFEWPDMVWPWPTRFAVDSSSFGSSLGTASNLYSSPLHHPTIDRALHEVAPKNHPIYYGAPHSLAPEWSSTALCVASARSCFVSVHEPILNHPHHYLKHENDFI